MIVGGTVAFTRRMHHNHIETQGAAIGLRTTLAFQAALSNGWETPVKFEDIRANIETFFELFFVHSCFFHTFAIVFMLT